MSSWIHHGRTKEKGKSGAEDGYTHAYAEEPCGEVVTENELKQI